jgi:four helix bundle protein
MFLELAHTKLNVYQYSQELALECYKLTRQFPLEERFSLTQQIRRAVLSVHLNISEGASRRSKPERTRFFEIARGSVIEIDAAIGIACKLSYVDIETLQPVRKLIINTFKTLSGMISQHDTHN